MKYEDVLPMITKCPFCSMPKNFMVQEYDTAYLTLARAPYSPHHLLVIPKAHKTSIFDLSVEEHYEIQALIRFGIKLFKKKGYNDMTVLIREGKLAGKSIPHLHYHIIPQVLIGDINAQGKKRDFLTEEEMISSLKDLKKNLT